MQPSTKYHQEMKQRLTERRNRRKARRERLDNEVATLCALATRLCFDSGDVKQSHEDHPRPRRRAYTSRKGSSIKMLDQNNNVVPMTAVMSPWYITYISEANPMDSSWNAKFKRRFRLSYPAFMEIARLARLPENNQYFNPWTNESDKRQSKTPLELLLLGALRYIGRGWTFDDIEESTGVSEEVHRLFFLVFIRFGREFLYNRFVVIPETSQEAFSKAYTMAGFPGCIGSMDASHVLSERLPQDQQQSHLGYKLPGTARTYNLVVTHERKILCSTFGHPSRWNDKTLVRYDKLAMKLRSGDSDALDNHQFTLLEKNSSNNSIIERQYKGAWLLVDNGYLEWSCTIPPMKTTISHDEIRFSEWLESLRKDVECTFGIMKGRFRCLKAGVRLHGIEKCDRLWLTCCALHNFLLDFEGESEKDLDAWRTTALGNYTDEEVEHIIRQSAPHSLARLQNPAALRAYDSSRRGRGNDRYDSDDDGDEGSDEPVFGTLDEELLQATDESGCRVVRKLTMKTFRKLLIAHFTILYSQDKIVWPKSRQTYS